MCKAVLRTARARRKRGACAWAATTRPRALRHLSKDLRSRALPRRRQRARRASDVSADKTHAVQPGDEITVSVEVTGFTLDGSLMGQSNQEGVGHYSVHLDDTGTAPLAVSAERSVKVTIPQGHHRRVARRARGLCKNNDSTPLSPARPGQRPAHRLSPLRRIVAEALSACLC